MARKKMEWGTLLSNKRPGQRQSQSGDVRSDFQRDIDRILFSDPFRRLARKTQVHPLNENDHVHSRLTHSLEASSVGRSLGEQVGEWLREKNELPREIEPFHLGQIIQAACLAHDIGNPPFGHNGETAIKRWFTENPQSLENIHPDCQTDFTKFDGNAMSVRTLLSTGFYREGMSPTYAVLGALLKYPWPSSFDSGKEKFSYFQTEADAVEKVARQLGMIEYEGRFARHPLAYLTEAADDICYRTIDLEDATEVGILSEDFMLREFAPVLGIKQGTQDYKDYADTHFRPRNSKLRTKLIGAAINEVVEAFKKYYDSIMHGEFDYKAGLLESADAPCSKTMVDVYDGLYRTLFLSNRKIILEIGAQNAIAVLFQATTRHIEIFCADKKSHEKEKIKHLIGEKIADAITLNTTDCPYHTTMAIVDYVAGMTDHYATELGRKFMGLGF